jgi:predicted acyltransferase
MTLENKANDTNNASSPWLECIDIFRGLTMAFMLLVNNPGNPENIPGQLAHASWNGITVADLVFPFFIFIMGVVVPVSINNRLAKGTSKTALIIHIVVRSSEIFLLGLFLNGFPLFDLTTIRIPGVLQRIAVVYLFSALLYLLCNYIFKKEAARISVQLLMSALILFLYYFLLKYVQTPGAARGVMELQGNLVQYIDLKFLPGHLYKPDWDPEGILSTLPAVGSGIIGVLAGMVLLNSKKWTLKMTAFISGGVLLLVAAKLFNPVFPYNKNLWSSSYVLLTSGLGILLLAFFYLLTDRMKSGKLFKPLKAIGSSAIFVYFTSELIRKSLWLVPVHDSLSGQTAFFKVWLTKLLITPWAHGLDSLYFSIFYVLVWLAIMGFLHRRKIYIRL